MDSLASPFTESKELLFACATGSPSDGVWLAPAKSRSLESA
jgi:hypothetical protein